MSALALTLRPDQVALLAAVAHRERTPSELAATLQQKAGEIDRALTGLRKLELVSGADGCVPAMHSRVRRAVVSADRPGLLVLAESPLLRTAAR